MAKLVMDPAGVTHVVSPSGDGEFTFCGREVGQEQEGLFGNMGEIKGFPVDEGSSSNCKQCRHEIAAVRKALKNLRWRSTMVDTEEAEQEYMSAKQQEDADADKIENN